MSVDRSTVDAARAAASQAIVAAGVDESQRAAAAAACDTVLWGITPYAELPSYLQQAAKLPQPIAEALARRLEVAAKPTWEKVWAGLDEQQRHWHKQDLAEDYASFAADLDAELVEATPELDQQPSVTPLLAELLDGGDRYDATALLAWLAQRGRLVGVCMQDRGIREDFTRWVNGALGAGQGKPTVSIPAPDQWGVPMTALLLQYLLEVRLGWNAEQSAMAAMYLAQQLAKASGEHSYATAVYGDEATGEFRWRPVRLQNGQVVFAD